MPRLRSPFLSAALTLATMSAKCPGHAYFVHFEGRQTHPVAVSADGQRLLALNTPHGRLSVFDISNAANPEPVLVAEIPVGLEPVSLRERSADEIWVVNEVSDSVSIVSLSAGSVVETLRVPDEPADVVFANGRAFVTCARNHLIRILDPVARLETGTIPLDGLFPRAMALSADASRLFAACLLSGNGTTILPAAQAPPPPPPTNVALPPAPQTGLIVVTGDPRIPYTVTDHDVAEIDTVTNSIVRWHSGVGTNLFDLAVHPVTGDVWVANTDARNAVRFTRNLRGHAVDNRLSRILLTSGAVSIFDLNPGIDYNLLPNPSASAVALAQPTNIVWAADGSHAWVAAFGSDRVAKMAADGTILARVDVRTPPADGRPNDSRLMRGPRALALHPSLPRLDALNRISDTLTVIDTESGGILAETGISSRNPVPDYMLEGRGFLFDARLSGNGTMSCASCHIEADHDGLAWDLGDPDGAMTTAPGKNLASGDTSTVFQRPMHPMKGPMLTKTLRVAILGPPYNWRGDHTLHAINSNFVSKLGGSEQSLPDLQVLLDYLISLPHHPNPNRNLNNSLPISFSGGNALTGQQRFNASSSKCTTCHSGPRGSNNNIDDPVLTSSADYLKTPALQTLYQRANFTPGSSVTLSGFGFTHDGSSAVLPMAHSYADTGLTAADDANVAAYLMCFDSGTAPVVGFSRTMTTANRGIPAVIAELVTMEQAAANSLADVVARGRLEGRQQVFLAGEFGGQWYSDRSGEPATTRAELLARLQPGDALTFMGVLRGFGLVFSVDHNDNATYDGDEAAPIPFLVSPRNILSLHGPNDSGWAPEWSASLTGPWQTLTMQPYRLPDEVIFPNVSGPPRRFFRLRRTW